MKRALLCLLCVAGAGAGEGSWAQPATTPPVEPPTAYQDRLIEGLSALEPDNSSAAPEAYNAEGWPRYLRWETRLGTSTFDNRQASGGVALYGLIETPNYGALSADLSTASQEGRAAFTLRQRGLPVAGGWLVNNEAGVIGTPVPSLSSEPSRIYLPGYLIEGLSTEWDNAGHGLQLMAGAGQPGRLEGTPTSGFRRLSGDIQVLGAQLDRGGWALAARTSRARQVSLMDTSALLGDRFDADSVLLSARYQQDDRQVQANWMTTDATNVAGARQGIWIDGEWRVGAHQNTAGFYRLDKDLSWAGQSMPGDTVGIYGRTAWRTRQWSAEGGLDWLRTLTRPTRNGIFATGSVRWRYSRRLNFGAGTSLRRFNGDAWSSYADARWQNDWGSSSLRLDFAGGLDQTQSHSLGLDHDWLLPTGWSLATGLTMGRDRLALTSYNRWGAAASLSAPVSAQARLRGNVSTERNSLGDARTAATLSLNQRLNTHWSLEGNITYASGQSRTPVIIDPLALPGVLLPTDTNSHSALVILRYEVQAGSRSAPLGGRAQDGGGRIEGTIYLDVNRSGIQEASETGAAGVTVFLDNRYAARTDAQGRFEFPFVASGPRTISVRNDTLPLPWNVVDDGQVTVDVRLRETTRLSIPVQRSN